MRFISLQKSLVILALIFLAVSCGRPESPVLLSDQQTREERAENAEKNVTGVIGIEVAPVETGLLVVAMVRESPAAKAGIKGGDIIIAVDGMACSEIEFEEAVQKIRGEPGSAVSLKIIAGDPEKPVEVSVKRENMDKINKDEKHTNTVPGSAFGG